MLTTVLWICIGGLTLSIIVSLYILITGPSIPDRVLALDTLSYNIIAIIAILSMLQQTRAYLEVILLIGILAFLGTIALSKFIESGVVIESKRDD